MLPEDPSSDYFVCASPNEFALRVLELSRSEDLLSRKTKMFIELFDQVPNLDDFGRILTETINSKL